ncbi:TPA: hypothetical protein RTW06_002389 [Staphylococcus aureus]|nr:hypothetical protein [Staphylococcus aureus]
MIKPILKIIGLILLVCVVIGLIISGLMAITNLNEIAGNILSVLFAILLIVISVFAIKLSK